MIRRTVLCFLPMLLLLTAACSKKIAVRSYTSKHVVLVSIDGPRWSETWGESLRRYIPHRSSELLQQGTLFTEFRNQGYTYTSSGHTAMLTGVYQEIENTGRETPTNPNIFQYWRWKSGLPAEKAWIISSKDKIEALANCLDPKWAGKYMPATDCGVNGNGTGYRADSITYQHALTIFKNYHPVLTLVHFREPDYSGHAGDWSKYLDGIKTTDSLVWQLWNFLQADPEYRGSTTMMITNDHGRHLDGIADGFKGHGDNCEGCRRIELIILGPDVRKGQEVSNPREQIDISSTIADILHFPLPTGKGKRITEAFLSN
ncbi:MAG: sulfatase [Sphingobacteriales bacterium]|nr:MAG: sulfatase [Sphingobacteriales bacterium]